MHQRTFPRGAIAAVVAILAACGEPQRVSVAPAPLPARPAATAPWPAPANCGLRADELLERVNAARAVARQCGRRAMAAAAPLKWDAGLQAAAAGHSLDMARRNYLEHRTPEGRGVRDRVAASPTRWKTLGENLSGGTRNAGEAVRDWLASPAHCENLMDPGFTDMGAACVQQAGTEFGTYWTLVLGQR